MNFTEMGVGDVGVNLSGADVGMSKKSLDGSKIGAVHEKVGCERVTKGMRSNMLGNTCGASVFFDNTLDRTRC